MSEHNNKVRLDRWLWAARFYKTRGLAVDAIKRGRITVNQIKVKPAKLVTNGDQLGIRKAQMMFNITISELSEKRLGAKLAQALYTETQSSIDERAQRQQQVKADRQTLINGRPSKKNRRLQQAIKRQHCSTTD